jgi:hypothetical protein
VIQDALFVSVKKNVGIHHVSVSIRSVGTASASHYFISINKPISPAALMYDYMPYVPVGHVADHARRATYVTAAKFLLYCVPVGQVSFELNRL